MPNETSTGFTLLQEALKLRVEVHGLKVLMKEDFTPTGADAVVFTWAPVVTFMASVMSILVIPFALTYTFGHMAGDQRQGWVLFTAMAGVLAAAAAAYERLKLEHDLLKKAIAFTSQRKAISSPSSTTTKKTIR